MTSFEIVDYLKDHGVPANKKTLRSDIALMVEAGLDIVTVASKPNLYFWGDRGFEIPELKLLIDAVSSSRFITQKKRRQLGKKLSTLASKNQQKELKRHVYATNRAKSPNENIYYSMDTINRVFTVIHPFVLGQSPWMPGQVWSMNSDTRETTVCLVKMWKP